MGYRTDQSPRARRSDQRAASQVDPPLADAIELIPVPAFVVSRSGAVLVLNAAGHAWLAAQPSRSALLARPGGPDPGLFRVSMSTERQPGYCLAILRHAITVPEGATDAQARIAVATRRWKLTPRQGQVLEQLSRGLSNARIAEQLGCAEATVEIHVSRVLDRAGVDSRTSLLAALVWGHS
jgi:DNA-binding CsgD family transcriptional regulator